MCSRILRSSRALAIALTPVLVLCFSFPVFGGGGGVTVGEVDDFEGGTCENWAEGGVSPNPPVPVADGGPGGAGDAYCENASAGGAGAGSRWVVFNRAQWSGNYSALGPEVTLSFDVVNQALTLEQVAGTPIAGGTADAQMRLAIEGINGDRWVSTTPQIVPADDVWRTLTFTLSDTAMTQVLGTDPIASALVDVFELRLVSSASAQWQGDAVALIVGIDNVFVESVPVELQSFTVD